MYEGLTTDEQKALEKLYESVAHRIVQDESKSSIIADLVKQGWSEESAVELINNIEETVEEYEEPPKEWKRKKARQYMCAMLVGLLLLLAGIALVVYGIINPEIKFILPIGLVVVGIIDFFWALPRWLKYRK